MFVSLIISQIWKEKQQYGPLFWLGQPFPIQKWSIRCNAIIQNKDLVNGIGYLLDTPKERLLNVGRKGKNICVG